MLLSVATFGLGFLTRPLGAVMIGAYADRAGRKPALLLTVGLMSLHSTFGLVATPSYASIGIAAPIILVLSRLAQGLPSVARSAQPTLSCWNAHRLSNALCT